MFTQEENISLNLQCDGLYKTLNSRPAFLFMLKSNRGIDSSDYDVPGNFGSQLFVSTDSELDYAL
jgi:hypothetical protein